MITITDVEFEKGKTVINYGELNKKWDTEIIATSSRLTWKVEGEKSNYGQYVKADNIDDALKEVIPQIQLQEFFEHSFSFKELGLSEPCYENEEGEIGTIQFVDVFLGERRNLHILNEDDVLDDLRRVACDLFPVVVK